MSSSNSIIQEKWVQWVALTTTVLAVLAAISSLRSGSYSTKVQLLTTEENSQWGYFQAKSIKEHMLQMQRDSFELMSKKENNPDSSAYIQQKLQQYDADLQRYKKEKSEIKESVDKITKEQEAYKRHGSNFGLAVMFLQIAIMLSSVGALLKRKMLWVAGLGLGLIAALYFINGFYLLF